MMWDCEEKIPCIEKIYRNPCEVIRGEGKLRKKMIATIIDKDLILNENLGM